MIPTMMLFGVVLGRWPWAALVAAAVGWPALLVVTHVMESRAACSRGRRSVL